MGYVNTALGVNVTFLRHLSPIGNIGFISQSGALGSVMDDIFAARPTLGFSYFVSLGNKTVIDESDVLEYLAQDSHTKVIGMYLENVRDGERFRKMLAAYAHKKPIIILKSGTTDIGSKAAMSHTGGMVGNDQVFDALLKQYGVIRAENFEEFFTLCKLYSCGRIPQSNKICIISNAGGAGVLLTDEMYKNSFELTPLSDQGKENVKKSLARWKQMNIHNPIDLLGDATSIEYKTILKIIHEENSVGCILALLTPQANTDVETIAECLKEAQGENTKPIFPVFMGEKSVYKSWKIFEEGGMMDFASYDHVAQVLRKVRWREDY
ncbi:hypothetical protein HGB07_02870, partial [Candidatus Roizmanbacteria bacterium]|nr:hypothetical protein [Candidatus Roizmanbacteria bacterium]